MVCEHFDALDDGTLSPQNFDAGNKRQRDEGDKGVYPANADGPPGVRVGAVCHGGVNDNAEAQYEHNDRGGDVGPENSPPSRRLVADHQVNIFIKTVHTIDP